MKTKEKQGDIFRDWKTFLLNKFSNRNVFLVEKSQLEDSPLENYTVSLKDGSSKTKIKFKLFNDKLTTIELLDIYFVHPISTPLDQKIKHNLYRFKWQSFKFYDRNFRALNQWLEIPLNCGWTERYTYYKSNLIQTEAIWKESGGIQEFLLSRNHIKSYGCLALFLMPFDSIINKVLTLNSTKFETREEFFQPMLKNG